MATEKINIMWLRRDLRLTDNTALFHALSSNHSVQCVFIFDTNILNKLEDKDDRRVNFIYASLVVLQAQLEKHHGSLHIYYGEVCDVWRKIMRDYNIDTVFANHDYEPYANARDQAVCDILSAHHIPFLTFKDQVVFEKSEIIKNDMSPYTVFTPYKNKYMSVFQDTHIKALASEKLLHHIYRCSPIKMLSLDDMGFAPRDIAIKVPDLEKTFLTNYGTVRNFPAMAGTSRMSVHLRFGTVSIRQLFRTSKDASDVWTNELIWREFYMMILHHFPHVVGRSFKPAYDNIPWRNDETEFERWCNGQTGYPIVDAGMRELLHTGFMHNRVRMIVASFLVKHLLIDWRWGEAWFARHLIDFELSSNNGGWQWAASSGCDAAPYFRIFNPAEQTKRFDSNHMYIKKWVPEYLDPHYPKPIVEHSMARNRCLQVYKNALA